MMVNTERHGSAVIYEVRDTDVEESMYAGLLSKPLRAARWKVAHSAVRRQHSCQGQIDQYTQAVLLLCLLYHPYLSIERDSREWECIPHRESHVCG